MTDLLPLRPSKWREARAGELKPGDVFFVKGTTAPIEVLSHPRVVRRGFSYVVGQWGFQRNLVKIHIRRDGRLGTLEVDDMALVQRPKRRWLPRPS